MYTTDAEMLSGIKPELRLGEDDQFAMSIGFLLSPEIDEARESAFLIGKGGAPDTRELGAVEGRIEIRTLEETLVKQLDRPGGREIPRMSVVGRTHKGCLLITAGTGTQTSVIFYMA